MSTNNIKKRKYSKISEKKLNEIVTYSEELNANIIRNNNAMINTITTLELIINKLLVRINNLEIMDRKTHDRISYLENIVMCQYCSPVNALLPINNDLVLKK